MRRVEAGVLAGMSYCINRAVSIWSDFDQAEFDKALASFSKRERRMGGRGGSAS
jgi:hypothetical protein